MEQRQSKPGVEDLAYILANFVTLDVLCMHRGRRLSQIRAWVEDKSLPQPTYVLPDGREMYPLDHLSLLDAAGSVEGLKPHFEQRCGAAARACAADATAERIAAEWHAYLSGQYGACLRLVDPESMVMKAQWVTLIGEQLAAPKPDDPEWGALLRTRVNALDSMIRPFAAFDRIRFGGPVSRDRWVFAPRAQYPHLFDLSLRG